MNRLRRVECIESCTIITYFLKTPTNLCNYMASDNQNQGSWHQELYHNHTFKCSCREMNGHGISRCLSGLQVVSYIKTWPLVTAGPFPECLCCTLLLLEGCCEGGLFKETRAFHFWQSRVTKGHTYWESTNVKHPTFCWEPPGLPWGKLGNFCQFGWLLLHE
jgi:hypothetical protein